MELTMSSFGWELDNVERMFYFTFSFHLHGEVKGLEIENNGRVKVKTIILDHMWICFHQSDDEKNIYHQRREN